ncbi:MAG: GyrI-like domain-containing protein [Gordonibacter sp.]|uniref:GyrI-like domain-containing protein n=2 Tax=Gordonibacter sp. TaxID=1968902 RepID=UPI002FC81DAD
MGYTIVELPEQHLIGLAQTGLLNDDPACGAKIGAVWQKFNTPGTTDAIPAVVAEPYACFGAYYDYDLATNGYTMLVGCASTAASAPEGMARTTIPAGRYAKFSIQGDCTTTVGQAWLDIWNDEELLAKRAFTVDFEAYLPGEDMANASIDIYLALK